jgi:hypothetical protein
MEVYNLAATLCFILSMTALVQSSPVPSDIEAKINIIRDDSGMISIARRYPNPSPEILNKMENSSPSLDRKGVDPDPDAFDSSYANCYYNVNNYCLCYHIFGPGDP